MPVSSSFDLIGEMSILYRFSKLTFTSGNFFMMLPPFYFFIFFYIPSTGGEGEKKENLLPKI
jgi:hypothetical protein